MRYFRRTDESSTYLNLSSNSERTKFINAKNNSNASFLWSTTHELNPFGVGVSNGKGCRHTGNSTTKNRSLKGEYSCVQPLRVNL